MSVISALLALYLFFNSGRRLLVASAPTLLHSGVLTQDLYGFTSSFSSICFGIFRFLAYYLMDWFPIDKYVSIASVSVCCVCIMMSIMQYDNSSLLALGFILLDVTLGLPFPCSSIVIQKFIEPHCSDIRTLSTRSKPSLVPSSAYIEFRSSYFYFTGLLYPIDPKGIFHSGQIRYGMYCRFLCLLSTDRAFQAWQCKEDQSECRTTGCTRVVLPHIVVYCPISRIPLIHVLYRFISLAES